MSSIKVDIKGVINVDIDEGYQDDSSIKISMESHLPRRVSRIVKLKQNNGEKVSPLDGEGFRGCQVVKRGKSDTDARATNAFCCLCHGNICQQVGKYPKKSDNDSDDKYFQAHLRFHSTFDMAVLGRIS